MAEKAGASMNRLVSPLLTPFQRLSSPVFSGFCINYSYDSSSAFISSHNDVPALTESEELTISLAAASDSTPLITFKLHLPHGHDKYYKASF